jgi:hypothetical protein
MNIGMPIGIPWYESEGDYLAVVAMLPAAEGQDPISYDAFRAKMVNAEQEKKREGFIPIRVPIDAVTLKGWVEANNLRVCRASIAEFVMIAAALILKTHESRN